MGREGIVWGGTGPHGTGRDGKGWDGIGWDSVGLERDEKDESLGVLGARSVVTADNNASAFLCNNVDDICVTPSCETVSSFLFVIKTRFVFPEKV